MAKFVMECPNCGNYVQASTGLFAKKTINCTCGYTIDVKADRMTSRICEHCGNTVLFDQKKGANAVCPVCKKKINTLEEQSTLAEVSCPSCGCTVSVDKSNGTATCPLCDTKIDVAKAIEMDKIKKSGKASVIKYEGAGDTLIWKHPVEDFNLGSQLIVHETQEAIFFRDGQALDLFGAGRYTLATQNLPALENLYKLPVNAETAFHSEIYFVNLTTQMGIKWGTDSKVRLFDPASGMHVELGACGSFNMRVSNSRKLLLKLVGTANSVGANALMGNEYGLVAMSDNSRAIGLMVINGKFKSLVVSKVKANLAKVIKEQQINVLEIDEYLEVISEKLKEEINEGLEEYGLTLSELYVTNIATPDDDPNFKRLKQQFAEKTLKVRDEQIRLAEVEAAHSRKIMEAQTQAQVKMVGAQGDAEAMKIKAMAEVDAYKAKAMAEAEEMRAKGYTYQQETSRKVGMEAMQNGIGGGKGSSAVGDIIGLGVTLGAMSGVVDMTKNSMKSATEVAVTDAGWDCACGKKGITSKFCPECGAKKPEPKTWDCACGTKGITSKFCPECGAKKPESATWDCACGTKGITSKFCPECGAKKEN